MKNFRQLALTIICLLALNWSYGQTRYLEQVFPSVKVTQNLYYGANYTVLTKPSTGKTVLQPLGFDFYEPEGDTKTERPLVIYLHTGNFLPHPQNQSPSGTIRDSVEVEIATRLAKMGYVVAVADYRLGWNPQDTVQDNRVYTLINAAYRGVQDARSCIRYFKINQQNYGIDTNRIVLFGQGTGGYISMASATLDSYQKIYTTTSPALKFVLNGNPMVIEPFNGNIEGTSWGIPLAGPFLGDTLCIPNNTGPTSKFHLCVNLGGALGDISWLDANSTPFISFQSPTDPFAPYTSDILVVPGPNLPIVEVQGSYLVQQKAASLGLNSAWTSQNLTDIYSTKANQHNDGYDGLYPIYTTLYLDSSPWDWWNSSNPNNAIGLLTNPTMSAAKGRAYVDTILGYYAPRAYYALNLSIGTKDLVKESIGLKVSPNPAGSFAVINTATDYPMESIELVDITGKLVAKYNNIKSNNYRMERGPWPAGSYYVRVKVKEGVTSHQVIFH